MFVVDSFGRSAHIHRICLFRFVPHVVHLVYRMRYETAVSEARRILEHLFERPMMETSGSHPGTTTYTAADVRGSLAASGISPNSEVAMTVIENLRPLANGESVDDRWLGRSQRDKSWKEQHPPVADQGDPIEAPRHTHPLENHFYLGEPSDAQKARISADALEQAACDFEHDMGIREFDEATSAEGRRWVAIEEAWNHQGPFMEWLRVRARTLRAAEGD